jgi:hypothetical protein
MASCIRRFVAHPPPIGLAFHDHSPGIRRWERLSATDIRSNAGTDRHKRSVTTPAPAGKQHIIRFCHRIQTTLQVLEGCVLCAEVQDASSKGCGLGDLESLMLESSLFSQRLGAATVSAPREFTEVWMFCICQTEPLANRGLRMLPRVTWLACGLGFLRSASCHHTTFQD